MTQNMDTIKSKMLSLLRDLKNNCGYACQNAEHGNEKAVYKYEQLAAQNYDDLEQMINQL